MSSLEPAHAENGPSLELKARVSLAHARVAHLMDAAGIATLHVKGYAVESGVYHPGRISSDVDLLVRPHEAARACEVLLAHGWARLTDFSEGSIFHHAATLWHDHLGYVDVHRMFPGLGASAAEAFGHLWVERTHQVIAGRPVPVPSVRHQRLVVIVHAARDSGRGVSDVEHLRSTLDAAEWADLRAQAEAIGAGAAWTVATGENAKVVDARDRRLFEALRDNESGMDLLATRWAAAETLRERVGIAIRVIPVNRPHLQMKLGHTPARADILRLQADRVKGLIGWLRRKAARRGR